MTRNVGPADRIIRLAVAVLAVVGAIAVGADTLGGIVLFLVAAIMLVTSVLGTCPLYRLIGVNTCKVRTPSRTS